MKSFNEDNRVLHGNGNVINGNYCDVYGDMNIVKGNHCDVNGNMNVVKGNHCTVNGNMNVVKGDHCVVNGDMNNIFGKHCQINGDMNTIAGESNTYYGANNMNIGYANRYYRIVRNLSSSKENGCKERKKSNPKKFSFCTSQSNALPSECERLEQLNEGSHRSEGIRILRNERVLSRML